MSLERTVAADETNITYHGWRVVAASAVGVFVSFASVLVYTFGVFLKPIATEFAWSRESTSAAFGVAALSVAACSPLLGHLLDRYGPRRIIPVSLTVFGGAFASMAWLTPHLWHLYAVFVVLGVVANGSAQMAYSRTVSTWFFRRRGLALAIMMCGSALGAMVMPPVAQGLIAALGWRNAFLALGTLVLVIGLPPVLLVVRERPGTRAASGVPSGEGATVAEGLGSRVFWVLVTVLFVASIAQNGAIAHLSSLLTDRGVEADAAALAMSALGGASLLGRLFTGWLLDRFAAGRVAFALLSLAALGTLLLSVADTLALGALGAALIGFGMGGEADVVPYVLSRAFGLRSFTTLYGLTWSAYAVAGAIGPVLMGRVFDATGSYEALLVRLAAATLAAGALMLLIPRPGADDGGFEPVTRRPVEAGG